MMSPLKFITCPLEIKVELLFPVTFPDAGGRSEVLLFVPEVLLFVPDVLLFVF